MSIQVADLLLTKLRRPGVPRDLVPRPRLIERLDSAFTVPLTLVCAPAGFGKTTLVSTWIEQLAAAGIGAPRPCAWLSLDESDSDLVRFLGYLAAAVRSIFPDACAETLGLLAAPRQPPAELLFTSFSNALALLPGPFVLVLDEYSSLRGDAVHAFLGALIRHWPEPIHLILISRMNPPLPLAALRARGLINEFRTRDLRFTREETAAYLERVLPSPLGESALDLLEQRAEGWAAGLHLAALSLQAADAKESVLESLSGTDANIADYLVDEVLSRQPPEIQAFLLRTSIFEVFCTSLCEAVVGGQCPEGDVRACMDRVERADLFLIPLDNRREWYRYHHLFRDMLQERLLVEVGPEGVNALHCSAAAWYAERGWVDEAARHALAAHDLDLAARLMEQGLRDVLNREDRPTLERWLHLLPDEIVRRRPGMLILKAWSLMLSWQLGAVESVLQQLETLGGDGTPAGAAAPNDALLRGQVSVLRGQRAYHRNQPAEALAYCEEALELLPPSWTYARGGAMLYWGVSMRAAGQGDGAQRLLLDEYETRTDKGDGYALRLLFAVCHNAIEAGQLDQARRTAEVMLEHAVHGRLIVLAGWARFFLGLIAFYRNELDVALERFDELFQQRHAIHALAARNGMMGLALAQMTSGDARAAWQTAESLGRFDRIGTATEPDDAASLRAQLHLMQGRLEDAFRWAREYATPVPDQPLAWLQEPHLTAARVLLARGTKADAQAALEIVEALHAIAERTHNTRGRIETLALRALALDAMQRKGDAQAALLQSVELSRPGGFVRPFVDLGPHMREMLAPLAAQGFAVETIRRILAAFPASRPATTPGDAQSSPVHDAWPPVPGPPLTPDRQSASRNPPQSRRLGPGQSAVAEPLTMREYDVLMLLRERLSNKEIADRLYLSTATVKRHLVNIYGKLGVNRRLDAVLRAEALGILPPR